MYKLIRIISVFLRTYIFPNPFVEIIELYLANTILSSSAVMLADIFNFYMGATILHLVCYNLVGVIYEKGEAPAMGSILYVVFMFTNSKLLIWISQGLHKTNLKLLLIRFLIMVIIEAIILFCIKYVKKHLLNTLYLL